VTAVRVTDAPAVAPVPVQAAKPAPTKPFIAEAWVTPVPAAPAVSGEKRSTETATAVVEDKTKSAGERKPAAEEKQGKDSWFSVSSSPWEAKIQKANELASAWDAPATSQLAAPKNGTEKANGAGQERKFVGEEAVLPPVTLESIREEAAQVAEEAAFVVESESASEGNFYASDNEATAETPAPGAMEAPATTVAPNTNDLVAKVLAKLTPEVLQAVTREILKPVVEAMVKEELKAKKS